MEEVITTMESPIDVMYLLHKAFRAQSERVEKLAAQGEAGGDLTEFKAAFEFWIKQLLYHATVEDKHMTAPLTGSQAARDNEAEHAELVVHGTGVVDFLAKGDTAGLSDNVKAAMAALEQEQHQELVAKAQEVEEVLKRAIGEQKVVARTRRNLYRRVMALRVLEFDHFENEEAFVLPLVRESMPLQELSVVKHLLLDPEASDPRWIIDWVASELTPQERQLLAALEGRFEEVATAGD